MPLKAGSPLAAGNLLHFSLSCTFITHLMFTFMICQMQFHNCPTLLFLVLNAASQSIKDDEE
jgi:hypothetical protein